MEVAATSELAANLNDQAVGLQAEGRWIRPMIFIKSRSRFGNPQSVLMTCWLRKALPIELRLYRLKGAYDEAERIFQIAQRIWTKRGFPQKLSDSRFGRTNSIEIGCCAITATMFVVCGSRVAKDETAHQAEMTNTLERLGPWYHNVVFAPG